MPSPDPGRPKVEDKTDTAHPGALRSTHPAPFPTPSLTRYWLSLPFFGVAYFATAWFGHALSPPAQPFVTLWLPNGLYLAVLLLCPIRIWPALVLTAITANTTFDLTNGQPLTVIGLFSLANSAEALTAAWLVRRFVGVRPAFESPGEALRFTGYAVALAPVIGASIGTATIVGLLGGTSPATTWLMWWSGDATGILLVAPTVLGLAAAQWRNLPRIAPLRRAEFLAIVIAVGLVGWLSIDLDLQRGLGLKYLVIPLIGLAIVRFGLRGASLTILILGLTYAWHTTQIDASDAADAFSPMMRTISLQLFLTVLGISSLVLSALLTERRQREQHLRKSTALQKLVFESSYVPLVVMDAETHRYVDCNSAAVTIYRYASKAEVLGKSPLDFSAAVQHDGVLSADKARHYIERALAEGSVEFEWLHRRPDGELWDADVHLMRFTDDGRRLLQFSLQDITERRRAAATLRESEEKFASAFRNSPISTTICDLESGRHLEVNDRCIAFLGYAREEIVGHSAAEIGWITEADREENLCLLKAEGGVTDRKMQLRRKNGSTAVCSYNAHVLAIGGRTCVFSTMVDITERTLAEAKLRESESHYRSLFDNMLNGFASCQMHFEGGRPVDFTYLAVNAAFETLTGLKDVVGRKVSEVIPGVRESDPQLLVTYGRGAQTGVPEQFEYNVKALQMWFSLSVYSPRADHFVAVFEVITERKLAESVLREQLAELQRWQAVMLDREDRVLVLKREVNALHQRLGEPVRYPSQTDAAEATA